MRCESLDAAQLSPIKRQIKVGISFNFVVFRFTILHWFDAVLQACGKGKRHDFFYILCLAIAAVDIASDLLLPKSCSPTPGPNCHNQRYMFCASLLCLWEVTACECIITGLASSASSPGPHVMLYSSWLDRSFYIGIRFSTVFLCGHGCVCVLDVFSLLKQT